MAIHIKGNHVKTNKVTEQKKKDIKTGHFLMVNGKHVKISPKTSEYMLHMLSLDDNKI